MKKRSWVTASAFVWCLAGAVAIATYSGEEPLAPAQYKHAEMPGTDAATAPGSMPSTNKTNTLVPRAIQWDSSFEDAMQRARAQNKPVLIDFYADWCGPCKLMEKNVYPDRQVIAQSQNWITVKVNGEKRPDVMQAYGLSAYPTLVFAHGNGQPVKIIEGYHDVPELVQQMQEAFSLWNSTSGKA